MKPLSSRLRPPIGGEKRDSSHQDNPAGRPSPTWGWLYVLAMLLSLWAWQDLAGKWTVQSIPYSQFREHVARGEVTEATVKTDEIVGRIAPRAARAGDSAGNAAGSGSSGPFLFRTVRMEDPDLVRELRAAGTVFSALRPGFLTELLLGWVLPVAVMAGLWMLLARRWTAMGGGGLLSIGRSRARLVVDRNTGVTFADVAGCDEAKRELAEVVDFLKNPASYHAMGARIPKGALLVGPPGTGKTLLARAVAGEAGVPFFSLGGADFVEMFVGVGAARVRDLFQQAKQQAPCLVFIDEIDAIGRQRGVHVGAVNDEREQTLNALLVEMDGFEVNTGVILLAATNRPEVLDRALLRPGRFDRQIVVDAPDLDGREAVLRVHARDKKLADDADLRRLAAATAGFSGADLANVLNEAALLAVRRQGRAITQQDLDAAVEKVVAGPERRSRRLNPEEKRRVACHEAGHALVAAHSPRADPVRKISIVPRGRAALGYTLQLPAEDQFLLTRAGLQDRLRTLLGGRAAEEVLLSEISTGAQSDLERATALARQMVALYGMSSRFGLACCAQRPAGFLPGTEAWLQRDCSEQTAREMDEEVRRILDQAYAEAKELLTVHRGQLELITAELLRKETLDGAEFARLLGVPEKQAAAPPAGAAVA
ncbi:MAG: ATP-dependent zinc metalloprotease FtsH [Verrucomicrobiota bacterium]